MSPERADAIAALRALAAALPERPGRVILRRHGPVARIAIDNPAARGALTARMLVELVDVSASLVVDPPAAWILRGEGEAFCAGGHLADVRDGLGAPELGRAMAIAVGGALDDLLALPALGIAAIDGPALGGGAELCTAADLRLVGPCGAIGFVQAARGVAPGWGGARRLVRHVGRSRAIALLARAETLDAAACASIGLAEGPAQPNAVEVAERLVERLLVHGEALPRALVAQVDAADLAAEADAFAAVWGGPNHRALLDALPWGRGR